MLVGLIITLATVVGYSWYISGQISRLRQLQTDLTDRNRRDSLQLLRIQNDLNQLGLAMRDMLDADQPYPSPHGRRSRAHSRRPRRRPTAAGGGGRHTADAGADAGADERALPVLGRGRPDVAAAESGRDAEARAQIRVSLQARQAALNASVARLLVQNNASEAETALRVQAIYGDVQRQVYWFLAATLAAIVATSLYLIRANRRLFARLAALSDERRELARTLIATRESTLREIARELHDEFGQLLTAMGSMLGRAARQTPADSPLRTDLREIGEVAQAALENVRGLSQTLHPSILEELGLDSAIVSYLSTAERQRGVRVVYERHGEAVPVDDNTAIHVYRVLQEAVTTSRVIPAPPRPGCICASKSIH